MKNLVSAVIILFTVLLISSCDKSNSDLVGVWNMSVLEYNGEATSHDHSLLDDYAYYGVASNINATFEFSENPDEFISSGVYDVRIDTYYDGDTIVQFVDQMQWTTTGTWEKNGQKLILSIDGSPDVEYEIMSLTEDDLHLESTDETSTFEGGVAVDHILYVTNKFFKD